MNIRLNWIVYGSLAAGALGIMAATPAIATAQTNDEAALQNVLSAEPSETVDITITEEAPTELEALAQAERRERRPEPRRERPGVGRNDDRRGEARGPQMVRRLMGTLQVIDEPLADRVREALRDGQAPHEMAEWVTDALRENGSEDAVALANRMTRMHERMEAMRDRGERPRLGRDGDRGPRRGEGFQGQRRGPGAERFGRGGERPGARGDGEGFRGGQGPRREGPGAGRGFDGQRRGPGAERFGRGGERPGPRGFRGGDGDRPGFERGAMTERFDDLQREIRELQEQIELLRRQMN